MGKTKKVAGGDEPIVGVEVVLEPVVVQAPVLAIPVEAPHKTAATRALPDLGKHQVVLLPLNGNPFLIAEHCLGMAQTSKSSLLFGSLDHLLATASASVFIHEEFMDARLKLTLLGRRWFKQLPASHVALDADETESQRSESFGAILQENEELLACRFGFRNDVLLKRIAIHLGPIRIGHQNGQN